MTDTGLKNSWFHRLALLATALTLIVVVLGAWVRLSDAGLGCPDWPGCYGQLVVPEDSDGIAAANAAFPDRPLEPVKAWREMIHRYAAGTLGLLVLALAVIAWRQRRRPGQPVVLPLVLLALVIFQALLGMWTVTLLLKPLIVLLHLLAGLSTLGLLWWLVLRTGGYWQTGVALGRWASRLAVIALIVLVAQIALGGWTSSNYAALSCPDFPTCQNQWWPSMDFQEAFTLWRGLGVNYEGGVLGNAARVAIHVTHRLGALVTFLLLSALSIAVLLRSQHRASKVISLTIIVLLILQVGIGVSMSMLALPMSLAVAHNGVAALLLLAVVALNHVLRAKKQGASPALL